MLTEKQTENFTLEIRTDEDYLVADTSLACEDMSFSSFLMLVGAYTYTFYRARLSSQAKHLTFTDDLITENILRVPGRYNIAEVRYSEVSYYILDKHGK